MLSRFFASLGCAATVSCASIDDNPSIFALDPYVGSFVTISMTVNGQEATMLFDSGGGVTAITPNLAKRVDCDPYGKLVGHRMSGERVEFQKCGFGGTVLESRNAVEPLRAGVPPKPIDDLKAE